MIHDPLRKFFVDTDPTRDLSDAELDTMFAAGRLFERIKSAREVTLSARTPKRLWRRTATITLTSVLVLAGTAAAISFLRAPVRDTSRLSCFAQTSLASAAAVVPYSSDPLAACGSLLHWPTLPGSPSPHGSLCVLADGSLAGFPPSRTAHECEVLGLETFNGHLKSPDVADFESSVQAIFNEHKCMTLPTARREVLRLIGKHGLTGWHVSTSGSDSLRACATLALEIQSRHVGIVGIVN